MIKPRRIGHATFETPDLEKAIAYYEKFMGLVLAEREKDRAFLADQDRPARRSSSTSPTARTASSCRSRWRPIPISASWRRSSAKDGVRSELRNNSIPGMGQVLSFKDNKGTTIELFKDWNYLGKHEQVAGIGPLKLGHVAFYTPGRPGAPSSSTRRCWASASPTGSATSSVHALQPRSSHGELLHGPDVKLHHIAFELKDFMHLQNSCELMGQKKVPIIWGPLRHGPGHNIATYHRNRDEQMVEFFCELDQMKDEELGYFEPRPWHHDTPQRPKLWKPGTTRVWGPSPEDGFHRTPQRVDATGHGRTAGVSTGMPRARHIR